MALDNDIRVLARVDLFSEFTPEQLRLLAFGAESMRIAAGRDLYREGNLADSAFVIASGEVEFHRDMNGERRIVGRTGPGSILGGFSLFSESRRLTGATAATDVEAIRLNRKLFRRILEEYPDTAVSLHRRIAREFQVMAAEIEALEARFAEG